MAEGSAAAKASPVDITVMKEDFIKLDEMFESIRDEIAHPEKQGHYINPFVVDKATRKNVTTVAYNVASVTESLSVIIVRISEDGMKAFAKVVSNATSFKPFTAADIKKAATEKGVFYGYDDRAISKMAQDQTINREIVIAEGDPPKSGKDGRLEMHIEVAEGKSVPNILKGTEICTLKHPHKGRDGKDVRGHILKAKEGQEAHFPIGDGIRIVANKAFASFDGTLVVRNGEYSVVNELILDKNINQEAGIVGFAGTVIVNGNVTQYGMIRAGHGIVVNGLVTNANLEAEGSITINGKAINSTIKAKEGNVSAAEFIECTIVAGGSITSQQIANCDVKCVTGIECTTGVGKIYGGTINCAGNIECVTVGTRERAETVILMGDYVEYSNKKEDIEKQVGIINGEILKLNEKVNALYEKKKSGTATLEDDGFLDAASKIKAQKIAEKAPLIEDIKELDRIIEISKKATLHARTMIYGGAILSIGGQTQIINSDTPHATVRSNGKSIVVT